jgi:hypothetical protein
VRQPASIKHGSLSNHKDLLSNTGLRVRHEGLIRTLRYFNLAVLGIYDIKCYEVESPSPSGKKEIV